MLLAGRPPVKLLEPGQIRAFQEARQVPALGLVQGSGKHSSAHRGISQALLHGDRSGIDTDAVPQKPQQEVKLLL